MENMVIEQTGERGLVFFHCGNVAGYVTPEHAEELATAWQAHGGDVTRIGSVPAR